MKKPACGHRMPAFLFFRVLVLLALLPMTAEAAMKNPAEKLSNVPFSPGRAGNDSRHRRPLLR